MMGTSFAIAVPALFKGAKACVLHEPFPRSANAASRMDPGEAIVPRRVQFRRNAGWRKPEGVVYVGRPSIWGNPWRVGGKAHGALDPATAVAHYRAALLNGELHDRQGRALLDRLGELRGKDLGCWCDLDKPCHADVLLDAANRDATGAVPPA